MNLFVLFSTGILIFLFFVLHCGLDHRGSCIFACKAEDIVLRRVDITVWYQRLISCESMLTARKFFVGKWQISTLCRPDLFLPPGLPRNFSGCTPYRLTAVEKKLAFA